MINLFTALREQFNSDKHHPNNKYELSVAASLNHMYHQTKIKLRYISIPRRGDSWNDGG